MQKSFFCTADSSNPYGRFLFSSPLHRQRNISTLSTQPRPVFPLLDLRPSGKVSFQQSFMIPATGNIRQSQSLPWLLFDVRSITWNPTYQALKDYQQAWFLNLLFASWISERPGYLPDNDAIRTHDRPQQQMSPSERLFTISQSCQQHVGKL